MCKVEGCTDYSCLAGAKHSCNKCGAIDAHRTKNCRKGISNECPFRNNPLNRCTKCLPGESHSCCACGAINHHRTHDCRPRTSSYCLPAVVVFVHRK
jgi:hypothetical protein